MIIGARLLALACLARAAALEALHRLVDAHAPTPRRCRVATIDGRRGLVAVGDAAPGDVLLEVPFSCCVVERDAAADGSHWASRLASRLVALGADDPYAASLPAEPPLALHRWDSGAALALLGNATLEAEADGIYFWRDDQWAAHEARGGGGDRGAYLRLLDLVCSRTLRCGDRLVAAPLLDMANHRAEDEGGGTYGCAGASIALRAGPRGARHGDELFLDYGRRANDHWLLFYGFCPEHNRDDAVTLDGASLSWRDAPLSPDDGRRPAAAAALAALGDAAAAAGGEQAALAATYRDSKRRLLRALTGAPPADAAASAFLGS